MADEIDSEKPNRTTVGYSNPPRQTRFKVGQSGNPNGRPKGSLNMATVLARTLREKVVINENGKRKTVTKLEAAIKQVTNRAASGDLKAVGLLAGLVRSAEERAISTPDATPEVDEADEMVMLGILKRLESKNDGGNEDI